MVRWPMAQVWKVRAPGLGRAPRKPRLTYARWLALGAFAGGLVGVGTSYLAYTGRQHSAAAFGIASGMVGAIVGALQVLAIAQAEEALAKQSVTDSSVVTVYPAGTTLSGLWW